MENAHNLLIDQVNLEDRLGIDLPHPLPTQKEFLQMLEMNVEPFTYYLEEVILDDPFVEMDFHLEQFVPSLKAAENSQHPREDQDAEDGLPEDLTLQVEGPLDEVDLSQSLETYLFEQIMLYRQTPIRDVMVRLVEFLDERGYLPYTLEELSFKLNEDPVVVLDGVTLFKLLEPAGVGAYNLREALMLQTERDDSAPNIAYYLLETAFDELVRHDYEAIQQKTDFPLPEIMEAVDYYQTLQRVPANLFEPGERVHVIPDVKVEIHQDTILLKYNRQYSPRVYFNKDYYDEMAQRQDPQLAAYIEQEAERYQTIAKEVRLREELVMSLAQVIVRNQKTFFLGYQREHQGLTLRQIAREMGIPENYVARLIKNKYLEFKKMTIAMADFINQAYTPSRDGLSVSHIKDKVKAVITHSDQTLTNEAIAKILEAQGIVISNRVVEVYRNSFTKKG